MQDQSFIVISKSENGQREYQNDVFVVSLKGLGPSTTVAWPGWKQPDIPVEVDTARLETSHMMSLAGIAKLPAG
jgi:hypothetical protein